MGMGFKRPEKHKPFLDWNEKDGCYMASYGNLELLIEPDDERDGWRLVAFLHAGNMVLKGKSPCYAKVGLAKARASRLAGGHYLSAWNY